MGRASGIQATFEAPGQAERWRRRLIPAFRALRGNPNMLIGVVIMVAASIIAIFAPLISTDNPEWAEPAIRLQTPSSSNWFGTDQFGRDVFSRVIHGSQLSLKVGGLVAGFTMLFGTSIGIVTGYYKTLDNIVMRFMDGLMAFPSFLLAIALVAILGPSVQNVVIAITVVESPRVVRIVRGSTLSLRERQFVEAALAIGAGPPRILYRHIFPNLIAPLLVQGTFVFAVAILSEAGLSFLGAGVPPVVPSWGNMMGESKIYFQIAAWTVFFPGLMLSLTVLGANLIGDGLRDTLDPRLRRTG